MKDYIHTSYLSSILTPGRLKTTVKAMCDRAVEVMVASEFEAIAFSGMSGAGVAFAMSLELGIPTIMVRKDDSSHHHVENFGPRRYLEGALDVDRYAIVDDQISSGRTVTYMMAKIAAYNPKARCVGIMLYNSSWCGPFRIAKWQEHFFREANIQPPPDGFPPVPVYGNDAW